MAVNSGEEKKPKNGKPGRKKSVRKKPREENSFERLIEAMNDILIEETAKNLEERNNYDFLYSATIIKDRVVGDFAVPVDITDCCIHGDFVDEEHLLDWAKVLWLSFTNEQDIYNAGTHSVVVKDDKSRDLLNISLPAFICLKSDSLRKILKRRKRVLDHHD